MEPLVKDKRKAVRDFVAVAFDPKAREAHWDAAQLTQYVHGLVDAVSALSTAVSSGHAGFLALTGLVHEYPPFPLLAVSRSGFRSPLPLMGSCFTPF